MSRTAEEIAAVVLQYGLPLTIQILRLAGNVQVEAGEADEVLIRVQNTGGRIPAQDWAKLRAELVALELDPPDAAEQAAASD